LSINRTFFKIIQENYFFNNIGFMYYFWCSSWLYSWKTASWN